MIKPLFWNVLLEIKKPEEKSAGGIIIAEQVQEKEQLLTMVGRVVELGAMAFKTKTNGGHDYSVHADDVKPGAWVLTARKFGVPIRTRDGRTYQLCNDYEIIAVISEEEAAQIRGYY